jgi:hypothetical protein
VTVMTESAEITDALLTPELIKAIEQAGHEFEWGGFLDPRFVREFIRTHSCGKGLTSTAYQSAGQ